MEDNGKYIIGGKEIEIDYNEDVPLDKLNALKKEPLTALDGYYIRKHLHQFSHWADDLTVSVDNRILEVENKIEIFLKNEFVCKNDTIPNIAKTVAETAVKKIVNGSLTEMNNKLQALVTDGKEVHTRLDKFNTELLAQIKAVGDKTIYGSVINAFKKHFIRSSIMAFIIAGFTFAFIMAVFHISSFTDMFNKLWNFFK